MRDPRRVRTLLLAGVALSALGVVVASTVARTAGGVVVVAGWLLAIAGLHAFGRLGAERET